MSTGLTVRVQPRARSRGLTGWMADGSLKIRVSEPAEDGRANRAVEAMLAAIIGVHVSAVRITRGRGSRTKVVDVDGLDAETVAARITAAIEGERTSHGG